MIFLIYQAIELAELDYQSSYILDMTTPRTRTGSGTGPKLNLNEYKARLSGEGSGTGHWGRDGGNIKSVAPEGSSVRSGLRNENRDEFQTKVLSSRSIADSPYHNNDRTGTQATVYKTPTSASSQSESGVEYPDYGSRSTGLTSLLSRSVPITVRANSSRSAGRNAAVNVIDNGSTFDSTTLGRKFIPTPTSTSTSMKKINPSPKGLRNPPTPDAFAATLSPHSFCKSIDTSGKKVNNKVVDKSNRSRKGGFSDRDSNKHRDSTSPVVSSALKIIRAATGEKIEIDSDSISETDSSDARFNPSLLTSTDLNRSGGTVSFSGMRGDRGFENHTSAYRRSTDDEKTVSEVGIRMTEGRIFDSWRDEGKGQDGPKGILSAGPRSASPFVSTESFSKQTIPAFAAVARSTGDLSQSISQSIARTRPYLESDVKSERKQDSLSSSGFGSKSVLESEARADFDNEGGQETPSEILSRMRNRLQHQSLPKYSTPSSSQRPGYKQESTQSQGQDLIQSQDPSPSRNGSYSLRQGQGGGRGVHSSDSDSDSKSNSNGKDSMDSESGLESFRPKVSLWMEEENDRVLARTKQLSDSCHGSGSSGRYRSLNRSILPKEGEESKKEDEEEDDSLGHDDDDSAASNERYQKARATLFTLMHHKSPLSN